jgi:hypothetical protein
MRKLALLSCVLLSACSSTGAGHGGDGDGGAAGGGGNGGGAGGNGGGGGGTSGGGGGAGGSCGGMEFALARVPPNVMLVLDRSGSMSDPIATGSKTTKYADLTAAVGVLVAGFDSQMRLGATFYASDSDCAAGVPGPIADANGQTIVTGVAAHKPGGKTPTAATLKAVLDSGALTDTTRSNFVVLATDGKPNCGDTDVTSKIDALYSAQVSVPTFVIGIGSETNTNPDLLNEWAVAGHTARAGTTKYFQTNSQAELADAFKQIAGGVVSCDFHMAQAAPDPTLISVTEDGTAIAPSPTVGYSYDPSTNTVTLHGAACQQLKDHPDTKVQVVYGCPGLPPIS